MAWPEWPRRGSLSPWIGAEGGLSVNSVRTLHVHTGAAGGRDHAVRSGVVRYTVGLWALLCVSDGHAAQQDGLEVEPARLKQEEGAV